MLHGAVQLTEDVCNLQRLQEVEGIFLCIETVYCKKGKGAKSCIGGSYLIWEQFALLHGV